MTRRRRDPLLCELHAHSRWSDGSLPLREVVDLYGRHGFDVLCVTDHLVRVPEGMPLPPSAVTSGSYDRYLEAIEDEAARALSLYELLVIPGLELTYEEHDPLLAAHAVAVGLRELVSLDEGFDGALAASRAAGAALIAAHPYEPASADDSLRRTGRWAAERERSARLVDRFELFNRHELFAWVAEERLPAVATGDFHERSHLPTWKTLLPCGKEEEAVVDYLRSGRPAYFVQLAELDELRAAA
jgi:predicted metal-dependent phosphoesterase TrpH